ncbi:MAG: VWA domain-containing protein [Polyangiaceae bacterium]|nr:VWA domain-containing protein [Polyangiaceae bacterium]
MDRSIACFAAAVTIVSLAAFVGCEETDPQGTDGGGAGTSTSATTGSSTSTGIAACDPACAPPQFCSTALTCLDPGQCAGDTDCTEPGTVCDVMTGLCVPGGGCEDFEATIEAVPPNMLLVLDRSCSMTDNASMGVTKWEAAVAAIVNMTTVYTDQIRFGLTLFPDTVNPSCEQDAIPIPTAPGTEPAIQMLLNDALVGSDPNFPDGPCVTNIDTAMQQASLAPELTDPDRDNFVVLLTDGMQAGCNVAGGDNGTTQIITDMLAAGIPTFVIGFGNGIDPDQMETFANAGGVPNSGPAYYDAGDQASLELALETIATAAISCTFTFDQVPQDPSKIYVFFDGQSVPTDSTMMNGWLYDPATNSVTFYGVACDDLKSGAVTDVEVIFGCVVQ